MFTTCVFTDDIEPCYFSFAAESCSSDCAEPNSFNLNHQRQPAIAPNQCGLRLHHKAVMTLGRIGNRWLSLQQEPGLGSYWRDARVKLLR